MKKYTDEELSRILGEADAGNLIPFGAVRGWEREGRVGVGCINQAAYNLAADDHDNEKGICGANADGAVWFDNKYGLSKEVIEAESLLRGLEEQELA